MISVTQVRQTNGEVPCREVKIIEDSLAFTLIPPIELARLHVANSKPSDTSADIGLVELATCMLHNADGTFRSDMEQLCSFARHHGPLLADMLGDDYVEPTRLWKDAISLAFLAVTLQECANGSKPFSPRKLSEDVTKQRIVNPWTGAAFELFIASRYIDPLYHRWLELPTLMQREQTANRINYSFVTDSVEEDTDVLDV